MSNETTTVEVPADLHERVTAATESLSGFDDENEFIAFVLSQVVAELDDGEAATADRTDDDAVEDRLRQLGYVE
jgi:hypothetical protein